MSDSGRWNDPDSPHPPPHPGDPGTYPPPSAGQQPGGYPYPSEHGPPQYHEPMDRPGTVTAGCVLAWIGGALGVIGGIALGALPADSALFRDQFDDPEAAASVIHTVGYTYAVWCVAVIVVAIFAFLGRRWAATTLLVMAVVVLVLTLVSALSGQGSGLVSGLWAMLSALLVHRLGDSKAWFDRMEARRKLV